MSELPAELIEYVAQQVGERHCPSRIEIRPVRPRPCREDYATDDEWLEAKYVEVSVSSPGADGSTMATFRAEDGCLSLRSLTWREVTADVLAIAAPLIAAKERERIAAEIEAQPRRHRVTCQPPYVDCGRGPCSW